MGLRLGREAAQEGGMKIFRFSAIAILLALAPPAAAQQDPKWMEPIAPFRIAEGLYYVGSRDLGAYLVDGGKGKLILLDAGLPDFAPRVLANVRTLGFDPKHIRILLNTHGHYDHAGGLAAIKAATGARLYASAADTPLLERGGTKDFAYGDDVPYPPVAVDGTIRDGQTVTLGTAKLTAHLTPGHTKGCTSWSIPVPVGGRSRTALVNCSISAPGYKLLNNAAYPDIVADYRTSFAKLRRLRCDIPLAGHGGSFDLDAKRGEAAADATAFVDPSTCRAIVDAAEARLDAQIVKEKQGVLSQ